MTDRVESWLFDLRADDARLADYVDLLAPDEQQRFEQIRHARDKRAFAARRAQLRQVLSAVLDISPCDLLFDLNEFGKPSVRDGDGLSFNTSSSGDIGLCVVSLGVEIGCDIEQRDPAKASVAIAERFFAPDERVDLAALGDDQWLEGFFNCWTRKEALLKCDGRGLSGDMGAFTVSLAPGAPARVLSHDRYRVAAFRPSPDYHVAIVASSGSPLAFEAPHWWAPSDRDFAERLQLTRA